MVCPQVNTELCLSVCILHMCLFFGANLSKHVYSRINKDFYLFFRSFSTSIFIILRSALIKNDDVFFSFCTFSNIFVFNTKTIKEVRHMNTFFAIKSVLFCFCSGLTKYLQTFQYVL